MSKTICFYHDDMDGICSAAIVNWALEDVECYPVNYGLPFPWDVIGKNDLVIMVDFGLKPEEMDRLNEMCGSFIWIDHHKTAIDTVDENISGLRRIGVGACELVWEWFRVTDENPPLAVTLIGMFDIWEHNHEDVIPFHYGIRTRTDNPKDVIWEAFFNDRPNVELEETIRMGRSILDYVRQDFKSTMEACAFKTTFMGIPTIAINRALCTSMIFDDLPDRNDYAILCTFYKNKVGLWKISLYGNADYPEDIDVSKIATEFGGGGHKMASGFESTVLPFQLNFEEQV